MYPAKLFRIIRNECQAETARVRRDEKIVRPDHRPLPLEIGTNCGVVDGRKIWKIQNLNIAEK